MLKTVIMTIIIAVIVAYLGRRFTGAEKYSVRIVGESVAVGLALSVLNNYLVPKYPELSWLFLILIVAFICGLMYQWNKQGSELSEFVCFAILTLIAGGIACAAGVGYTPATAIPLIIAVIFPIFALGFYAYTALKFHRERNANDEKKVNRYNRQMAAVVVTALIIMAGAAGVIKGACDAGGFLDGGTDVALVADGKDITAEAADSGTTATPTPKVKTNWHFYNNDVQGGNSEDDFNFGPEPKAKTASSLDADFRKRLENDPALGAADMAWADAWLGTRYLGEFYESCNEDWAKTINAAKEAWIKDPAAYKQTLDAFFQMLNTAEVKVTAGNGLEDQMYMNPYTVDGTPDVIVLATPDHTGKFLSYYFTIKGTGKVKVSYRVECGYQPTNVEQVMGITPQKTTPKKSSNPGKTPGKGDNPTPTPTPTPNVKDPSKAPKKNTEPNDDKGPGEKTINPKDPNHSTKDRSDNSTSGSYQDYKNNVNNLKDTNKNQKTGSDSNTPSTPAPTPSTNVDNNGDKGTGNGGINKPTQKQEAQTVKNDPAAGQMSEPS